MCGFLLVVFVIVIYLFFFFKQKTAYEMRISDWSSDVCSSDLVANDYALAVWGLKPVRDPAPLLSPDILADEFTQWVELSWLLKRAFREVAVIAGDRKSVV